jgi:2-phospho-L-lactate guanylyltransferase
MERTWRVVVPLRLSQAKTRLSTQPAPRRRELVIAMALDVISAARACSLVDEVVLVADPEGIDAVGADIPSCRDPGDGLNEAIRAGAAGASGPVAALLADVPCATAAMLELALASSTAGSGFLCDAEGIGTTLVAAPRADALITHFGPRSRAAHAAAGIPEIHDPRPGALAGLRRDVDSEVDLWDARRLGLGRFTAAVA